MIYGGLDLARRSDYSALVTIKERQITAALRIGRGPYAVQIRSVAPILEGLTRLAFDRGGVGDAVAELLPPGIPAGKRGLVELFMRSGVTVAPNASGRAELLQEMRAFAVKVRGMEASRGHDDLVMAAALTVRATVIHSRI